MVPLTAPEMVCDLVRKLQIKAFQQFPEFKLSGPNVCNLVKFCLQQKYKGQAELIVDRTSHLLSFVSQIEGIDLVTIMENLWKGSNQENCLKIAYSAYRMCILLPDQKISEEVIEKLSQMSSCVVEGGQTMAQLETALSFLPIHDMLMNCLSRPQLAEKFAMLCLYVLGGVPGPHNISASETFWHWITQPTDAQIQALALREITQNGRNPETALKFCGVEPLPYSKEAATQRA